MSASLERLARWFKSQIDGSWESDWGVTLQTLDNPGWMLEVNLDGTPLYAVPFKHLKTKRGKDDWVECAIQDHGRAGGEERGRVFVAAGGPGNLEELVSIFCDWAEQASSRQASSNKSQTFRPRQSGSQQSGQHRSSRPQGRPQDRRQGPPNSSRSRRP